MAAAELSAGIKISISGSVTQKVNAGSIMQIIQTGTLVTTSKIRKNVESMRNFHNNKIL